MKLDSRDRSAAVALPDVLSGIDDKLPHARLVTLARLNDEVKVIAGLGSRPVHAASLTAKHARPPAR